MSWLSQVLFGTEDEAAAKNQWNMDTAFQTVGAVDVPGMFGMSRAELTKGREDVLAGFRDAIAGVGAAGTGASLDALARGREATGAARQNLARRGMYGSSQMARQQAGIGDLTSRTLAGIAGNTAAMQGQLSANRGQALAGIQGGMAGSYQNQAQTQLQQAMGQAGVLTSYQHQGSPGLAGPLLSGGLGFLGGYFGMPQGG